MKDHYGQILEYRVRRAGISITDIARHANVNRRTVYNWFNTKYLSNHIIILIGTYIRYDFSIDLPHLFNSEDFQVKNINASINLTQDTEYWKTKYLTLMEDFNKMLLNEDRHVKVLK